MRHPFAAGRIYKGEDYAYGATVDPTGGAPWPFFAPLALCACTLCSPDTYVRAKSAACVERDRIVMEDDGHRYRGAQH